MFPRFFPPWLFAAWLFCSSACIAQTVLLVPKNIHFEGSQEYTTADLLPVTGLKPGQTYDSDYLNQAAQKLMATGLFEGVSFKFNGVDLVYALTDSPNLYPVQIDNLPLQTGPALDAALRKRVPLYRGKVPSEGSMLDSVRQALDGMLADEGLPAHVTPIPAGEANTKATGMKFLINSPPVFVGDVTVEGASQEMTPKLTNQLRLGTRLYNSGKTPGDLASEVAMVYDANGYPVAQVHAVQNGRPTLVNGAIRVPFVVQIDAGKKYRLGKVELDSSVPVDIEDAEKLVGSRTRFTPENLYAHAVQGAVNIKLHARGYLDCVVQDHPQVDEAAGVVNYTITAKLGPVYHLGLLKFQNVGDTLRARLMRSWQMMPGDPFDDSYVGNFMFAVQKNNPELQRALAGVKTTYDVKADPQTHDVNVTIRLERQ